MSDAFSKLIGVLGVEFPEVVCYGVGAVPQSRSIRKKGSP